MTGQHSGTARAVPAVAVDGDDEIPLVDLTGVSLADLRFVDSPVLRACLARVAQPDAGLVVARFSSAL
jgi:FXSXX-COOH protein